jgi:hypothetical protein
MRLVTGALALALTIALFVPAQRAAAGFSDTVCPEATQYVVVLGTLKTSDPPQKIYDAAHAATSAYDLCAKRHLGDGNTEPGVHYAYTREASFDVLEARALVALDRPADAKQLLESCRKLAQDVVDWRRSLDQNGGNSPGESNAKDNRPSVYHDAAKDVLDAANAMLAKLNAAPGAATAAPAPHR